MPAIHCHLPIQIRLFGHPTPAQLDALGERLAEVVQARLAEAGRTLAQRAAAAAPSTTPLLRPAPRETPDPARYDAARHTYAVPSYQDDGALEEVTIQDALGEEISIEDILEALPAEVSYREHRHTYREAIAEGRPADAAAAARDLLAQMSWEDALGGHAWQVAAYLYRHGYASLAQRYVDRLESAWWLQYASRTATVPRDTFGSAGADSPAGRMVALARMMAENGRDAAAADLLTRAFLFTQMQLEAYSEDRTHQLAELEAGGIADLSIGALGVLARAEHAAYYERLREIVGLYPALERQARAAADADAAARYQAGQAALLEALRAGGVLSEARFIVMESLQTRAPGGGVGYRLFGTGGREEIITPLPGAPHPDDLGQTPSFFITGERLLQVMADQEAFHAMLRREPAIRAEFGATAIDMNDRAHRVCVFRTLYGVFARRGANPLADLIAVMERYLKAYTRHTVYNIRDFGANYLTSDFPESFAGQLVRDCGVYALTVAYEVFLVARSVSPRLALDFRLFATPDHAMLAIVHPAADTHYLVNNDTIDGPRQGTGAGALYASAAEAYGRVIGRTFFVSPVASISLGSTAEPAARFRRRAWRQYRTSTSWGLAPLPPEAAPEEAETSEERQAAAYEAFYRQRPAFEQRTAQLGARLEALSVRLAQAPDDDARRRFLASALPDLMAEAAFPAAYFEQFGVGAPGRFIIVTPSRRTLRQIEQGHLFQSAEGRDHPLLRLGLALLYHQALGGALTPTQQGLLNMLARDRGLQQALDAFQRNPAPSL